MLLQESLLVKTVGDQDQRGGRTAHGLHLNPVVWFIGGAPGNLNLFLKDEANVTEHTVTSA